MHRLPTSLEIQSVFGCDIVKGDETYDICRFNIEDTVLEIAIFPMSADISVKCWNNGQQTASIFVDRLLTVSLEPDTGEIYAKAENATIVLKIQDFFCIDVSRLKSQQ